jgi:hypothetical protein
MAPASAGGMVEFLRAGLAVAPVDFFAASTGSRHGAGFLRPFTHEDVP